MAVAGALEMARDAFARRAWTEARAAYAAAREDGHLSPVDLERVAIVAHLLGDEAQSREALAECYRRSLERNDLTGAARFTFWLGHSLFFAGDMAQANGWLARGRDHLAQQGVDCVEWGYLLLWRGVTGLWNAGSEPEAASPKQALDTFTETVTIARRFGDLSLEAMARHGRGRALIRLGQTAEGDGGPGPGDRCDHRRGRIPARRWTPLLRRARSVRRGG